MRVDCCNPIGGQTWISGQIRRVTKAIRREMRRRAAVEPVIGHLKDDHRMRRNAFQRLSVSLMNGFGSSASRLSQLHDLFKPSRFNMAVPSFPEHPFKPRHLRKPR